MRHDLARREGGSAWVSSSRHVSSDSEPGAGPIPTRSRGSRRTCAARHHCSCSAKRDEAIVHGACAPTLIPKPPARPACLSLLPNAHGHYPRRPRAGDTFRSTTSTSTSPAAVGCSPIRRRSRTWRLACRWRLTGGTLARQRLNFPRSRRGARASASHRRDRGAACHANAQGRQVEMAVATLRGSLCTLHGCTLAAIWAHAAPYAS